AAANEPDCPPAHTVQAVRLAETRYPATLHQPATPAASPQPWPAPTAPHGHCHSHCSGGWRSERPDEPWSQPEPGRRRAYAPAPAHRPEPLPDDSRYHAPAGRCAGGGSGTRATVAVRVTHRCGHTQG